MTERESEMLRERAEILAEIFGHPVTLEEREFVLVESEHVKTLRAVDAGAGERIDTP